MRKSMRAIFYRCRGSACLVGVALIGCGSLPPISPPATGPLFAVPLAINGQDVGNAIVDTGGGYEVLLRERFGLAIVDEVEVLAFGGIADVEVTEGFSFSVGDFETETNGAIVDGSICDCNGLGFRFLRRVGLGLALDFELPDVSLVRRIPEHDVSIPFLASPPNLTDFDTAFVDVDVSIGGRVQRVRALFDTGASATVMRRSLLADSASISPLSPQRVSVLIEHRSLGSVALDVSLFDTLGLPDLIIGTEVMQVWGDRWYFEFNEFGGRIVVDLPEMEEPSSIGPSPTGANQ